MVCSLCKLRYALDKELPYCEDCWSILESGGIPPVNFREYFSDNLEENLIAIDSLLFNNPDHFFLWYLKGHLEHELGSTKRALRSINTSISYNEEFGDAWIRLGLIYSDMHRDKEALENFERGLKYPLMDPTNLVDAGSSLQAAGNPRLASKILHRALDLVPDDDRILLTLGKVQMQMDEIKEAESTLELGLKHYPHNEEMLRAMALLMLKEERYDSAMDMYERILDQHPRDFEALLAMGEISLKIGEYAKAIKYYKAVKDIDVHISWSGVLKFIISNLKEMIGRNVNCPSYRDSLRKEYENSMSFIRDIEEKVENSPTPDLIDEMEDIMKMVDHQKVYLREQLKQSEELLKSTSVEDSFHQHLLSKVSDLRKLTEQRRFFDAKEVSLELLPFISDLREVDHEKELRFKNDVLNKLDDISEFGFEPSAVLTRMEEVEKLESESKFRSAMFILKEIDVSLLEHWAEIGSRFHSEKVAQMRKIIDDHKGLFDTSTLIAKLDEFSKMGNSDPKHMTGSHDDFMREYNKAAASYYDREADTLLQEIKYKLLLMEKDGLNTSEMTSKIRDVKDRKEEMSSLSFYNEVARLMEGMEDLENKHRAGLLDKMRNEIDELMKEIAILGLEAEIGPYAEPVRKVIGRSAESGNVQLAEILSKELLANVGKTIHQGYMDHLKNLIQETEGKVLRLKGLGVERSIFWELIRRAKDSSSDTTEENTLKLVGSISDLIVEVASFIEESLSGEISKKLDECRKLISESENYGIDVIKEAESLEKLAGSVGSRDGLEELEDAFKLESDLEKTMKGSLRSQVKASNKDTKKRANSLSSRGADPKKIMETMSLINRSEVLMENGQFRQAFEISKQASQMLDRIDSQTNRSNLQKKLKVIEHHLDTARTLGLDMKGLNDEFKELPALTMENLETARSNIDSLLDRTRYLLFDGSENLYALVIGSYDNLARSWKEKIPLDLKEKHADGLKRIREAINKHDVESLVPLFKKAGELIQEIRDRQKSMELMDRCSQILEIGFDIKDERSQQLMAKAQSLAERVQSGDLRNVEEELKEIEKESSSIRSILKMSKIEDLLRQIGDIDDLSVEVFGYIIDSDFMVRKKTIAKEINDLMDTTSTVYENSELDNVDNLLKRVADLKSSIMDMDSEWRAKKKMELLKDIEALKPAQKKPFRADMKKIEEAYSSREWPLFFSAYERFEEKVMAANWKVTPPPSVAARLQPAVSEDGRKAPYEPLPQPPSLRSRGPRMQQRSLLGGIGRIASEAFSKSMKMDTGNETSQRDDISTDDDSTESTPLMIGDDKNLTGIAKLIAGNRIEVLKREDSGAIDPGFQVDQGPNGKIEGRSRSEGISNIVDDFVDLDVDAKMTSSMEDIQRIKNRLDSLFARLPQIAQLEESKGHYSEGVRHIASGKSTPALREFKIAISSALKVCKMHADIGKALQRLKLRMEEESAKGKDINNAKAIYSRASAEYRSGKLEDAPKSIRKLADELKML
ncbi:MAG: tetratricopeptide repeat protein [Candidatus Thermoplasmatota archaeon]|nr:tetratricopeptide repeat protein [Candidatus Thermoplasmatota archaeon]